MVSIYIIKNKENGREIEINQHTLLRLIAISKHRHKKLYHKLVDLWEKLEGEKFREKFLED